MALLYEKVALLKRNSDISLWQSFEWINVYYTQDTNGRYSAMEDFIPR
jgi:hypothetical protein